MIIDYFWTKRPEITVLLLHILCLHDSRFTKYCCRLKLVDFHNSQLNVVIFSFANCLKVRSVKDCPWVCVWVVRQCSSCITTTGHPNGALHNMTRCAVLNGMWLLMRTLSFSESDIRKHVNSYIVSSWTTPQPLLSSFVHLESVLVISTNHLHCISEGVWSTSLSCCSLHSYSLACDCICYQHVSESIASMATIFFLWILI